MTADTLIKLEDVAMVWNHKYVLRDVNLCVNRGDFIAITGPNGGGKTTLLRIILRLLKPTEGRITYTDSSTLTIGYLPQKNAIDSSFPITVRDVIEMGITDYKLLTRTERLSKIDNMLELMGLTTHAKASLGEISGGQLQRALLGRALIANPQLLVLDEPLSYVDYRFEQRIYEIIRQLTPQTTIILVSHDVSTISSIATRHIIVNKSVEICTSLNHFAHYDCCSHHS